MPIKNIPKIRIGNYPEGQFAGGYIYSFQLNQGYSESRNEIKIDVVYDKNTNIQIPPKSLTTSYKMTIGGIIIPVSYLIEHSSSISPSESIVSFTFTDRSFILDKYYVGLINRHFQVKSSEQNFLVSANCANCENNMQLVSGYVERLVSSASSLMSRVIGDVLLVGEEEFTNQNCDIPDVRYSFSDLLSVMQETTYSTTKPIRYQGFYDINPKYKTSYVGTLREVLSNWCSDFGFSFYWDTINDKLICIDLRNPLDLSDVKDVINQSFSKDLNLAISNYSYSESLNGTYQKDYIDYILKPIRVKEKPIKEYFKINYSPIKLGQFLPLSSYAPTIEEIILAKYSPEARVIYTLQELNEDSWFDKIGFKPSEVDIPDYIFSTCLKNINEFLRQGGRYVIGTLDEIKQNSTNDLYSRISEKIGRYYLNDSFINWSPQSCNEYGKFKFDINYEPSPIGTTNPFSDIGGRLQLAPGPFTSWIIERNPTYTVENNNLNLVGIGPIYTNIDGEIADQIKDLDAAAGGELGDKLRGKVIIAFKPIDVGTTNNYFNPSEEGYIQEQFIDNNSECKDACEKDAVTQMCESKFNCKTLKPALGLTSKLSTAYTITNRYNGSFLKVITPAEQPYVGYVESNGTFSWTEKSVTEIRANPETFYRGAGDTLEYSLDLNDITTEEVTQDGIVWETYPLNSIDLNILQDRPHEKISLKIIGDQYGLLGSYLAPQYGLSNFNMYINDNGAFTDLTFESRPPRKPKAEVIMKTVGPQKMRIIK